MVSNQPLALLTLFLLATIGIHYLGTTTQNYLDMVETTLSFDLEAKVLFFDENFSKGTLLFLIDNPSPRSVVLYTSVGITIFLEEHALSGSYSYAKPIPPKYTIVGKYSFGLNESQIEEFKTLIESKEKVKVKMTVSAVIPDFKKMLHINKIEEVPILKK